MAFPTNSKLRTKGLEFARESAVQRSPMELLHKQQKVKSRVLITVDVIYTHDNKTDRDTFVTWFQSDIAYGASWFDWPDPDLGSTRSARIVGGLLKSSPLRRTLDMWDIAFQIEYWSA